MHCPACPKLLEKRLESLPGVTSAEALLKLGTTTVIYDGSTIDEARIVEEIRRCGFAARVDLPGSPPIT